MKALRIVLYVLGGAIVLLVIVAVIFIKSFDLNDYKDEITAYVEDRTGRTLAINDNIEFSLFPWFAVETGGVSLSDDPAFGDRSFVAIDSLSARVRVWPLLRRRIEIGHVILDGINLNLGIDGAGTGNWSSLIATTAPAAPAVEPTEPSRPRFETFAVEGVELRNARILWHDPNGEVAYALRDISVTTGPVNDDDPVSLAVALAALDVATQSVVEIEVDAIASIGEGLLLSEIEGSVRLFDSREQQRSEATFDMARVSVDDRRISTGPANIQALLSQPPVGAETLNLSGSLASIEVDTASEQLLVNGLRLSSAGINADVGITGESILSTPRLTGSIDLRSTSLVSLLEALAIEPPGDLAAVDDDGVIASAGFDANLSTQTFTLPRFTIATLGLEALGQAEQQANGDIRASIELPAFAPSESLRAILMSQLPDGVDLDVIDQASISAELSLTGATDRLEIPSFRLTLDQTEVAGSIRLDRPGAPSRIEGSLVAQGLSQRQLVGLAGHWLPADLVEAELGEFRVAAEFDYETDSGAANLAPLEVSAYGLSGDGELFVSNGGSSLLLSGRATLDPFSPRELFARFNLPIPQTSDPNVLRTAELAASFETNGANGEFRDIALALDDSRITGEFAVVDFADPSYRFLLRADRIDVDRYLPPEAPAAPAQAASGSQKRLGEMRLASEPLTATNVAGTASVGYLVIGGMQFEQFTTDLSVGSGQMAINSVRTDLYGGRFEGGLTIDASGETSVVRLRGDASGVALGPLQQALVGTAYMTGTGAIALDLNGRGATIDEALQSASGRLDFEFSNGAINGMNLSHDLCRAINRGRGLPAPASAPAATPFRVIRASSTVSDGIASTSDAFWSTGNMDLTGRGGVRLVDQWLDMQFRAVLTGPVNIAGCESWNETIANNPVPVNFTVKAKYPDFDIGVDVSQLLEDVLRREVRQRAQESVRDRLLDELLN